MTQDNSDYIETTIHKFKTHFSTYIKMLEDGHARGIVVKRYDTPVGMFVPLKTPEKPKKSIFNVN